MVGRDGIDKILNLTNTAPRTGIRTGLGSEQGAVIFVIVDIEGLQTFAQSGMHQFALVRVNHDPAVPENERGNEIVLLPRKESCSKHGSGDRLHGFRSGTNRKCTIESDSCTRRFIRASKVLKIR